MTDHSASGRVLRRLALVVATTVAPVAHAADWSGFHGGLHAGYGAGQDAVAEIDGPRRYFPRTRGLVAGGQFGWQRQFGRFVTGAELEAGWLGQSGDVHTSDAHHPGVGATVSAEAEIGAYAALTARLGYLLAPDWLLYGRAGLAMAKIDGETRQTCGSDPGCGDSRAATRDHAFGVTFGGGVEHALSPRWSLRAEYQYFEFRRELALPAGGAPGPGWNHRLDTHVAKFGVNYRF